MTDWNFDISKAPRGRTETRERVVKVKGEQQTQSYEQFIEDPILAATNCGKVIKSHWIPAHGRDGDRWMGFNKGSDPVAWAPWPEHPGMTDWFENVRV